MPILKGNSLTGMNSWTGNYWKHGDIKRVDRIAHTEVHRYRTGKKFISLALARKISVACRLLGYDLTPQDWINASAGRSDHEAFEPVYGDRRLWGVDYWDSEE